MNKHVRVPLRTGRVVGYQRIGTVDHTTDHQLDGIELDQMFIDHASVDDTNRPQLRALLRHVREGDQVVVHSMDRLARSLDDLRRIVGQLAAKGVQVRFIKEGLTFGDTSEPCAALMLSAMGAAGDFERALLLERQHQDMAIAKGLYRDERPSLTLAQTVAIARRTRRR